MYFRALKLLIIICTIQVSYGQTENESFIEGLIENLAENSASEIDYSELSEKLHFIKENPLDLNTVSYSELTELQFLSPLQIENLLNYRRVNGLFIELQELQLIALFDETTIQNLLPFIIIVKPGLFGIKNRKVSNTHEVITTLSRVLETQKGYKLLDSGSRYRGSSTRILTKYRYHWGKNISAALTMEKDAGEKFGSSSSRYGFDFYSASVFFRNGKTLKKLAFGDYSLQFGQGLSLWSGLGFGKGANIAGIAKLQAGLKPYTSANENNFFRGVAATVVAGSLEITPFISYKKLDASLNIADTLGDVKITSIQISGLHRTDSEIEKKASSAQLVFGSVAQYSKNAIRLGAIFYRTQFEHSFAPGSSLYNKFDFNGSSLTNCSIFYNYTLKNFYSFAEISHQVDHGVAMIGGIMGSLARNVSAVVFYRNYQKNYYSFFSQAVSEGSNASNEKGFYSGLVLSPRKGVEMALYTDVFKFPWMRYRLDAPSSGTEILGNLSWQPNKVTKFNFRLKSKLKEQNDDIDNTINYLVPVEKENYRLDFSHKLTFSLTMRNRLELVRFKKEENEQSGFLVYQDVVYKPLKTRLSGNIRIAYFNCTGYDARVYAFENDVLYSYSIPAYQDKGFRFYINTRFRLSRMADIWCRYAISYYASKDRIGSGLDIIEGSHKSDVKIQLRYLIK